MLCGSLLRFLTSLLPLCSSEISKSLLDNEVSFNKHIQRLRDLDYDILDVKATRWHDVSGSRLSSSGCFASSLTHTVVVVAIHYFQDYNYFKNGVKDLEMMMTNVITDAFKRVTTVKAGIELLEAFYSLAKRETIMGWVEKKTLLVFNLFLKELTGVKREYEHNRQKPPLMADEPKFAGSARWAQSKLDLVTFDWELLESAKFLKPSPGNAWFEKQQEAREAYTTFKAVIEEYVLKVYRNWIIEIEGQGLDHNQMQKRLELPLLRRKLPEVAAGADSGIGGGIDGTKANGGDGPMQVQSR